MRWACQRIDPRFDSGRILLVCCLVGGAGRIHLILVFVSPTRLVRHRLGARFLALLRDAVCLRQVSPNLSRGRPETSAGMEVIGAALGSRSRPFKDAPCLCSPAFVLINKSCERPWAGITQVSIECVAKG